MAQKTKTAPAEAAKPKPRARVDEFAFDVFKSLGLVKDERLPPDLVTIYNDYKRTKDTISPGRLSSEGFATVVTLYRLFDSDR